VVWSVETGDCREIMAAMDAASVDAIVTDPPYLLSFMGKAWDQGETPWMMQQWHETWAREAYRVLKPGAFCLAFGGTRTHHRLMCAIEDAGFEVRDTLSWLYGSGFPKSLNLDPHGGPWRGWGTALKPAWEPIILARKPMTGTVAANVAAHGTGALNIDATRIGGDLMVESRMSQSRGGVLNANGRDVEHGNWQQRPNDAPATHTGRWPANVLLSHHEDCNGTCAEGCPVKELDAQSGERPSGTAGPSFHRARPDRTFFDQVDSRDRVTMRYGDTGGASRFFYTAKASRRERNAGLDGMPERSVHPPEPNGRVWDIPGSHSTPRANNHPTVKPVAVMRWLVRLVTPPGGLVLDPFAGSGSTGIAALLEGFAFAGIEQDPGYAQIARRRIAHTELPLFAAGAEEPTR
jgi:site-specific DNA-methyltransferase (adenine-specific)